MIISGKDISLQLRSDMQKQVDALAAQYGRTPCLVVIQVGDDPASTIYVRNKIKAAEYCHIRALHILLPGTTSEQQLCDRIAELNNDNDVDGILVQLPLPDHINEQHVICAIQVDKDVDGFHPTNVAHLCQHQPASDYGCTIACTAGGIMALLPSTGVNLAGKRAVMIGQTDVVDAPMAKLLTDSRCTVTAVRNQTTALPSICRDADILIVAAGKPNLITADCIKPGAIVIDAGNNRLPDGSVVGDVDFEACKQLAAFITPVPGGVGPMIITMLMQNTIDCYKRRL